MNNHENLAKQIIDRFGSQSALAALLGKSQSTVQHWARPGGYHPSGTSPC